MLVEKRYDDAQNVLKDAQDELGDSVELRLQRARLSSRRRGPEVLGDLNALGQKIEPFYQGRIGTDC